MTREIVRLVTTSLSPLSPPLYGDNADRQWQIIFPFVYFFARPSHSGLIEPVIKLFGIRAFRVGNNHVSIRMEMSSKKVHQSWKRRSIIQNSCLNERETHIEHVPRKVERLASHREQALSCALTSAKDTAAGSLSTNVTRPPFNAAIIPVSPSPQPKSRTARSRQSTCASI